MIFGAPDSSPERINAKGMRVAVVGTEWNAQVVDMLIKRAVETAEAAGAEVHVFMVSGAEDPNRLADHRTFIDAAAAAGVHRIVYTSFFGATAASTFLLGRDHWFTEEHLRESGLTFTFLRNNLYADQFLDWAGPEGVLAGPAGSAPLRGAAVGAVAGLLTLALPPHLGIGPRPVRLPAATRWATVGLYAGAGLVAGLAYRSRRGREAGGS